MKCEMQTCRQHYDNLLASAQNAVSETKSTHDENMYIQWKHCETCHTISASCTDDKNETQGGCIVLCGMFADNNKCSNHFERSPLYSKCDRCEDDVCSMCGRWSEEISATPPCFQPAEVRTVQDKLWLCPRCDDVMLLEQHPRVDFIPNAEIKPEIRFSTGNMKDDKPAATSSKRSNSGEVIVTFKSQAPSSNSNVESLPKDIALDEQKLLYEIAKLQFARWPPASTLQKKHPHKWDFCSFLDEGTVHEKRHDYYVKFVGYDDDDCKSISNCNNLLCNSDDDRIPQHQIKSREEALEYGFETEYIQSVSGQVGKSFPDKFVPLQAIEAVLNGSQWGPKHPTLGNYYSTDRTIQLQNMRQMMRDWETNGVEASTMGTFVHNMCELVFNGEFDLENDVALMQFKNFQQFIKWKKRDIDPLYLPYRTEMRFLSKAHRLAGSTDLFCVRRDHLPPDQTQGILRISVHDYKNLAALKRRGFRDTDRGKKHCAHLPSCNAEKYYLQQEIYRKLAHSYRGFVFNGHHYNRLEVERAELVIFNAKNPGNEAIVEAVPGRQFEISQIWRDRAKSVQQWEMNGRPLKAPKVKVEASEEEIMQQLEILLDASIKNRIAKNRMAALKKLKYKNT